MELGVDLDARPTVPVAPLCVPHRKAREKTHGQMKRECKCEKKERILLIYIYKNVVRIVQVSRVE